MPKKKSAWQLVGAWAFLIGVLLAVIFAFIPEVAWIPWILVIMGIIVGLLNIGDVEVTPFLMAGVVLVIVSYFGGTVFGPIVLLGTILKNLLMLFVPATVIVALKSVFTMARA
ncbi:MAG: hypothetical protein K6T16_02060 [Candidatus Pacearchaeota archaeon]|nr:hypothetical protein [Candidatus Pacearchaeota archaeon]